MDKHTQNMRENSKNTRNEVIEFMAEENTPININEQQPSGEGSSAVENNGTSESGKKTPTVEELMAQLAAERAANSKNKAALDKALKENGNLTKSLRERQTAEELAAEAKQREEEQRQEYIADLEEFKKKSEAKDRYILQGMSAEMASEAADAEIKGDMNALSDVQKKYTAQLLRENDAKWAKRTPPPNSGTGESSMSKEEVMSIKNRSKRWEAIANNMGEFTKR